MFSLVYCVIVVVVWLVIVFMLGVIGNRRWIFCRIVCLDIGGFFV